MVMGVAGAPGESSSVTSAAKMQHKFAVRKASHLAPLPPPHPSHPRPSPALGSPPMYSLRLAASKLVHFCGRPHATVHHSRRGQAPPLQASVCKLQPFGKPHASSPRHLSQPVTSDAPFPIFIACNMQLADSMMPCAPNL